MKSYSQCKQDIYLRNHIFIDKTDGFFVDIGANDGITFSNTKVFEEMGWGGICVEPIPTIFKKLQENRTCCCVEGTISDIPLPTLEFNHIVGLPEIEMLSGIVGEYDERHTNRIIHECEKYGCTQEKILVNNYSFGDVVSERNIDLLCIDTEGNELKILKTIDFEKYNIYAIVVENNYNDINIKNFLEEKGYQLKKILEGDQIYTK